MDEIKLYRTENVLISVLYIDIDINDNKNVYSFGNNIYEYSFGFLVHRQELDGMIPKFRLNVYFNNKPHDIKTEDVRKLINDIISTKLTNGYRVLSKDDVGKLLSRGGLVVYSVNDGEEYIINPVFDDTHIRFRHNIKGGNSNEQYQNSSN